MKTVTTTTYEYNADGSVHSETVTTDTTSGVRLDDIIMNDKSLDEFAEHIARANARLLSRGRMFHA